MKKKGVAKVIARTFGKTLGVLAIMIGVGVASYFLTILYYTVTEKTERSTEYDHVIEVETGTDSANLIYSVNEENGKLSAVVLELYNGDTHNMDYITIPAATEVEMSSELYMQMMEESQEVPQIARLSKINEYFKSDVAYEYGILMLEEAMGTNIGYFTAIPSETFNQWFENVGSKEEPAYAPNSALFAKIGGVDADSIEDFMDEIWDEMSLDITLSQKQKYAEGFAKVKKEFIHAWRIPTEVMETKHTTYRIDKKKGQKLLSDISDNATYTKEQKRTVSASATVKSSKKNKIQITNGSQITGLAASYKEKLELDGYTVQGIGDYGGEVQEETRILITNKGMGKDLLKYFPGAIIEKTSAELTEQAEIEIILGTKARISEN